MRSNHQPLDLDTIRRDHPLPGVVGANIKLIRAGNELKACCPFHAERTPSFTIFAGGLRFHCFGCGASGDVIDFVQRLHGVRLRDAANMLSGGSLPVVQVAALPADTGRERIDEARAIWRAAQPIGGTLAETYLRTRGLHLPLPPSLRFTRLRYGKSGPEHPVLVACVAGPDDKLCGITRIYLNATGSGKASVPKPKLSLGRISGGAVRLAPCARSITVCEGIEDGLAVMQETGRAVWAALGTSNLGAIRFPVRPDEVVIAGDSDDAGRAAARKAADAYAAQGLSARLVFPLPGYKDFNAEVQGRACA